MSEKRPLSAVDGRGLKRETLWMQGSLSRFEEKFALFLYAFSGASESRPGHVARSARAFGSAADQGVKQSF